jgi:hypothetical protein
MDRINLVIFRFSRGIFIGLISLLLVFIVLLACCYIISILDSQNSLIKVFIFFIPPLLSAHILNVVFSKLIYKNVGLLTCQDNILVINYGKEILEFKIDSIKFMRFEYRGDYLWRSRNPRFQKCKSKRRYITHRMAYGQEKATFDKIIVNGREYYIKIKSINDKKNFYHLVDWAADHGVNFELIEDKYYMQFK